jgi:hypothetical protein
VNIEKYVDTVRGGIGVILSLHRSGLPLTETTIITPKKLAVQPGDACEK